MSRWRYDPEAIARALALLDDGYSLPAASQLSAVSQATISRYQILRDGRPQYQTRECEQCGSLFHVPPSRPTQRFCSASCAGWHRNGKPGRPPTVSNLKRVCRLCGTDITELHGRARYCTPRCARKGYGIFGPVHDDPQAA